jgi:hypothetical protein
MAALAQFSEDGFLGHQFDERLEICTLIAQSLLLGFFFNRKPYSTEPKNPQKNKTILFMKTNFAEQTKTRV